MLVIMVLILGLSSSSSAAEPWKIAGLEVSTAESGVNLKVDQFSFGEYVLSDVNYTCPHSLGIYPQHQCQNALAEFIVNNQNYDVLIDSNFNASSDEWAIELMSTNSQLVFSLNSKQDSGSIKFNDLQLQHLTENTENTMKSIAGQLNGVLETSFQNLTLKSTSPIEFSQVNYEYSDDIIVADLSGELELDFNLDEQLFSFEIKLKTGEMLFDQLYVNFAHYPIDLKVSISSQDGLQYRVDLAAINHQSLSLNSTVMIDKLFNWSLPHISINVLDSHHFNQNILSSVLGIYGFGKTEMSGGFSLDIDSKLLPFDLWRVDFNDFYVLNDARKLQVDALDGSINWYKDGQAENSKINWESLVFAGMPINEADLLFNFSNDQFNLLGAHDFSVFDGSIQLKELAVESLFSPFVDMRLNAAVLPISLKQITQKMGWPEMAGTISGEIPGMVKRGHVIEFMGALELSVFEGNMLIENLSLERLFGVAPVIAADVSFNQFNLSLLTEAFGFGQITGRLSGVVNQLRITNWKTDRLDAQVYTVKTKGVKQTISQRAIENISSLGGIKGAISKTFLRFFDDFSYKKIKLSCKLHNSVCEIGGLKNQNNQFVIVEGGGIPKINIVGFVRTINWEEFIDRLLNANYNN